MYFFTNQIKTNLMGQDDNIMLEFIKKLTHGGVRDILRIKNQFNLPIEKCFHLLLDEHRNLAVVNNTDDLFNKLTPKELIVFVQKSRNDFTLILFVIIALKIEMVRDGFHFKESNVSALAHYISALLNETRIKENKNLGVILDKKDVTEISLKLWSDFKTLEKK